MGYGAQNDEIHDNITRMRREKREGLKSLWQFACVIVALQHSPTNKYFWLRRITVRCYENCRCARRRTPWNHQSLSGRLWLADTKPASVLKTSSGAGWRRSRRPRVPRWRRRLQRSTRRANREICRRRSACLYSATFAIRKWGQRLRQAFRTEPTRTSYCWPTIVVWNPPIIWLCPRFTHSAHRQLPTWRSAMQESPQVGPGKVKKTEGRSWGTASGDRRSLQGIPAKKSPALVPGAGLSGWWGEIVSAAFSPLSRQ